MEGEGEAGRGSGTSTREAEGEQGSCEEPHTGRGEGPGASDQAGGSPRHHAQLGESEHGQFPGGELLWQL